MPFSIILCACLLAPSAMKSYLKKDDVKKSFAVSITNSITTNDFRNKKIFLKKSNFGDRWNDNTILSSGALATIDWQNASSSSISSETVSSISFGENFCIDMPKHTFRKSVVACLSRVSDDEKCNDHTVAV